MRPVMNDESDLNRSARDRAQSAVLDHRAAGTAAIQYRSRGRVLIIGEGDEADAAAFMLPAPLSARILRFDDDAVEDDVSVPRAGRAVSLAGHLGEFVIQLGESGRAGHQALSADLVLDLTRPPLLSAPVPPPGYLHAGDDPVELEAAVAALGELTGTFEKPRYFEYDPAICAHGRSGQTGCNRCVQACPAEAITGLAERIEVDPYLCQGGGVCATVCPSGAIGYAYPRLDDTLERIRRLLRVYSEAGGRRPSVVLVAEGDAKSAGELPDNALVLQLEELASAGIEIWLGALAFGAWQVALLRGASVPEVVTPWIEEQLAVARRILGFLGYHEDVLVCVDAAASLPAAPEPPAGARKVAHAPLNDKRNMLFAAVDTLAAHLDTSEVVVDMPQGAPFGRVLVDGDACTLCMACTSVCPMQALAAGGDTPRLVFHEVNCVQCGICRQACPEQAIRLEPRLNLDVDLRRRGVTIHEEAPFQCVQCGKAFATRSVISRMLEKLEGHPMFASERARRRLMMCDDCRVVDVVQDDDAMNRLV